MDEEGTEPLREVPWEELRVVEQAARNGARTVTTTKQIQADAAEIAVHRWGVKLLGGRTIENPAGWAFVVGMNAAKSIASRKAHAAFEIGRTHPSVADGTSTAEDCAAAPLPECTLDSIEHLLTPRMTQVLHALCWRGQSVHQAARDLGMDRSNLRRCFRRALQRVAHSRNQKRPMD